MLNAKEQTWDSITENPDDLLPADTNDFTEEKVKNEIKQLKHNNSPDTDATQQRCKGQEGIAMYYATRFGPQARYLQSERTVLQCATLRKVTW